MRCIVARIFCRSPARLSAKHTEIPLQPICCVHARVCKHELNIESFFRSDNLMGRSGYPLHYLQRID